MRGQIFNESETNDKFLTLIILLDRTAHIMAFTSEFYIFNIIGQVLISSSFLPPDPQCPSPQNIE